MLRRLELRSPEVHDVGNTDGDVVMNGHENGNGSATEVAEGEEAAENVDSSERRRENDDKKQTHGMAASQLPQDDLVQTPYLLGPIELPAQKQQVLQHVELLFALSVKVPEFLDE
jgi:symplekin